MIKSGHILEGRGPVPPGFVLLFLLVLLLSVSRPSPFLYLVVTQLF